MLNFNQPLQSASSLNEPSWKVLVYDEFGQEIISPLLTVKELRDLGVTAHLYDRFKQNLTFKLYLLPSFKINFLCLDCSSRREMRFRTCQPSISSRQRPKTSTGCVRYDTTKK